VKRFQLSPTKPNGDIFFFFSFLSELSLQWLKLKLEVAVAGAESR